MHPSPSIFQCDQSHKQSSDNASSTQSQRMNLSIDTSVDSSSHQAMDFESDQPEQPERFASLAFYDWMQSIGRLNTQVTDRSPFNRRDRVHLTPDTPSLINRPTFSDIFSPVSQSRCTSHQWDNIDQPVKPEHNQSLYQSVKPEHNQSLYQLFQLPSVPMFSVTDDRFADETSNQNNNQTDNHSIKQPDVHLIDIASDSDQPMNLAALDTLFPQIPSPFGTQFAQQPFHQQSLDQASQHESSRLLIEQLRQSDQQLITSFIGSTPLIQVMLKASDRMAHIIKQVTNRAISQSSNITSVTQCDWLYSMCVLFNNAPQPVFEQFLIRMNYQPHLVSQLDSQKNVQHNDDSIKHDSSMSHNQPNSQSSNQPADQSIKPITWLPSRPFMPRVTLPFKMMDDWSSSSMICMPDVKDSINVATLVWERPQSAKLFHSNDQYTLIPDDVDPLLTDSLVDRWSHVDLAMVDLSCCRLPFTVSVNAAFERLFGLSQSQILHLYMQHGLNALNMLCDNSSLKESGRKAMQNAVDGHSEMSRRMTIFTYKGPVQTVMIQRYFPEDPESATCKITYMWFPMPIQ